jgi:hypothetical protein
MAIVIILKKSNAYLIRRSFLENENIPYQFKNKAFHTEAAPIADLLKVCLWAKKEDVRHARKLIEVMFTRGRFYAGR